MSNLRELTACLLDTRQGEGQEKSFAVLGRPKISASVRRKILEAFDAGKSKRAIARSLGISDGTVRNVLAAMEAA